MPFPVICAFSFIVHRICALLLLFTTTKVGWRGRITGNTHRRGKRPRQKIVWHAQNYLDVMEVKPATQRSKMDQDDFMKNKAILDIDGNAWSTRLGKLLCFNLVVIKV